MLSKIIFINEINCNIITIINRQNKKMKTHTSSAIRTSALRVTFLDALPLDQPVVESWTSTSPYDPTRSLCACRWVRE